MNVTTPFYKKLSLNLLSISLIALILYLGQAILVPLCFSVLAAALLLPVVQILEYIKCNRFFSIMISILLAVVIVSAVIYFLSSQILNFFEDLPTIEHRLNDLLLSLEKWVHIHFSIPIGKQVQYIKETTHSLQTTSGPGGLVGQTFLSITEGLSFIVLVPIYAFLILYYRDLIRRFLIGVFKDGHEEKVKEILVESRIISQLYIQGLFIEMTIVFALNSIGFLILGIKYPIFLGLVAALLNLVPYIGLVIANIFCMLITVISCDSLSDVLWVGIVLAIVQFIDNNFLMPMIVGSKVRINSLATIVGVLVGGALWGVPGMFLSIPCLAVMKIIFDRVDGLQPYGMLMGDERPSLPGGLKTIPRKIGTMHKNRAIELNEN